MENVRKIHDQNKIPTCHLNLKKKLQPRRTKGSDSNIECNYSTSLVCTKNEQVKKEELVVLSSKSYR